MATTSASRPPPGTGPPRGWRRPVLQFIAAGLATAVLLTVAISWFSSRAARVEAVHDAESTTQLLAWYVVEPALTPELLAMDSATVDRFDRLMRARVISNEVVRVKIWRADGTIVYSDEPRLNGEQFELDDDELYVLQHGGTEAAASDLSEEENLYDQPLGDVVEVYTSVAAPGGERLLFEVYFSSAEVTDRADDVVAAFRPISVGGLALFLVLSIPIVLVLARRLDAAGREREALLQAAVEASDVERRRIARDLHDGVVQDLAGTAFALSAGSRVPDYHSDVRERLETQAAGVRQSLRALRSLLVEIYPPDLYTAGLPAALDDLVAPATAAGIDVRLDVADTTDVPDDTVGLLWRVAQESVRNALRHGRPRTLTVTVRRPAGPPPTVVLEVSDDGVGFDLAATPRAEHFGLRALHDLVAVTDATLTVRSTPGQGTLVRLEVPER